MELRDADTFTTDELISLYDSVGWSAYTRDPQSLAEAVANSTHVVSARFQGALVGLARCVSDDVSIVYLQDVLVHPDHQRQGIGRALLDRCLERFAHVRQKVLLTDDHPHQHRLYRAAGFTDVNDHVAPLQAFVRFDG